MIGVPEGARIPHPEGLDIRTFGTEQATAEAGAHYIMDIVRHSPSAVITYATGRTMEPVYKFIAQEKDRLGIDFSRTQVFHLDERYPCGPDDPSGFANFIRERVVKPLAIPENQVHYWNGLCQTQ